jgi:hypothetical protein
MGEETGVIIIAVFEVGEVDIYNSIEKPHDLGVFIATAVIHERNGKAIGTGIKKGLCKTEQLRCGGNGLDIVTSLVLKGQHKPRNLPAIQILTCWSMTDLVILAVDASEIAG